jgi:hypothetical protein
MHLRAYIPDAGAQKVAQSKTGFRTEREASEVRLEDGSEEGVQPQGWGAKGGVQGGV